VSLFDGKTLGGWRIVNEGDFARHGQVAIADGEMTLLEGPARSGLAWMGDFPTMDYELGLDLRRNGGHARLDARVQLALGDGIEALDVLWRSGGVREQGLG